MTTVSAKHLASIQTMLQQNIKQLIASKLQLDTTDIPNAIALGDLGFDSLALSDLAEALEDKFGVQVPNRTLPATLTVGQLGTLIAHKKEHSKDAPSRTTITEPAD